MMKITGLSDLFKWENLHNWWLTKYFFAPLYMNTHDIAPEFKKRLSAQLKGWMFSLNVVEATTQNMEKNTECNGSLI